MEGASGSWNPSSLTRRWRMDPRSATESVGFGRCEYRADDKRRQRSVHLLRSRSITPRRGCFAKRGTAALEGDCRWCNAIEAVGSTSIELAPGAGLPEMVVLRGLVILEGFGLRGSKGGKASAESFEGYSRGAKRSATRRDDQCDEDAAQAANTERAWEVERLGGCSGIESVAEVGKRHSACT